LRKGTLAKFYKHDTFPDISRLLLPDRAVLKKKRYLNRNIFQLSKGFPFRCVFCSVTEFFGNKFRVRNEDQVIEEIERMEGKFLIFVDDNIFGDPSYATMLLKRVALRKLGT